jgi:chloramphenicol-sensitive protein RarD
MTADPSVPADPGRSQAEEVRRGVWAGAAAFAWWGCVFPLQLIALNAAAEQGAEAGVVAPAAVAAGPWSCEILAHRVLWTHLVCLMLLAALGQRGQLRPLLSSRRMALPLAASSALIGVNWGVFILAVATGRLNETSLGYYLNPLLSIVLGVALLGERLSRLQRGAVTLAAAGVAWETFRRGELPWIALIVAAAFGLYGLLRKQIPAGPIPGLAIESLLLVPLAAAYLGYRWIAGPPLAFGATWPLTVLLAASGVATAAPLIWFAVAARRLPLSTVAFLQFITPTGQLITALAAGGESLSSGALAAFALIWLGVAAYLADSWR